MLDKRSVPLVRTVAAPEASSWTAAMTIRAATPSEPLAISAAQVRTILGRVRKSCSAIPMPAWVKRNLSKRETAFIAAAYAIPLPGTALIAALLVGLRRLFRRLRRRWAERSMAALVENG